MPFATMHATSQNLSAKTLNCCGGLEKSITSSEEQFLQWDSIGALPERRVGGKAFFGIEGSGAGMIREENPRGKASMEEKT